MRLKTRENFKKASFNPKFTVFYKNVYLKGLELSWFRHARYHNFIKQMDIRFKSVEGMRLTIELAALNCFSLLYHAPGRVSGTSNHTRGFLPNVPGTVPKW